MTDSTNTTKEEPKKAGKSFFFDFVNKRLDMLNNRVKGNDFNRRFVHGIADTEMLINLGIDREQLAKTGLNHDPNKDLEKDKDGNVLGAKEAVNMLISESKGRIRSIINDRLDEMKRNRETRQVERKIRRLDRQEAREIRRRSRKIERSGFSSKFIEDAKYDATLEVMIKNEKKRDSLLARKDELNKAGKTSGATFGSIFKEVKLISKARAEIIRAESRKQRADLYHQVRDFQLKEDRVLLTALGVVTAPAKMAAMGAKAGYEKVAQGAKKAKKKGLHARWVARDTAKKFKSNASTKWAAGKKAFRGFCTKIKDGATKTVDNVKDGLKSIATSVKGACVSAKITMEARRAVRKQNRDAFNAMVQAEILKRTQAARNI